MHLGSYTATLSVLLFEQISLTLAYCIVKVYVGHYRLGNFVTYGSYSDRFIRVSTFHRKRY